MNDIMLLSFVRKYFKMSEQGECCPDKMSGLHFGLAESLGSWIILGELRSTLCSILRLDLFLKFTDLCRVFAFRSYLETIRAGAIKLGSCIHLEE